MAQQIAWISGASAGIGRALADTRPDAGTHVIDISRTGGAPDTEHVPADLADPASWAALEQHFRDRISPGVGSALLIHNAGVLEPVGFAGEVASDAYRSNVLLNAAAPQVLGHAFLAAAKAADVPAQLVMLTSGAARSPYPGWSAYCAGKAAVDMWTRAVGEELAMRGDAQRVFAVAPGVVDTAMQARIREADGADFPEVDRFRALHEQGQLTDPQQAARGIWSLIAAGQDNGAVVDLRSTR